MKIKCNTLLYNVSLIKQGRGVTFSLFFFSHAIFRFIERERERERGGGIGFWLASPTSSNDVG